MNENTKITLTFQQLKKLVSEAEEAPAATPTVAPIDAIENDLEEILEKIDDWRTDGSMEHWQYSQLFDYADDALAKLALLKTPVTEADRPVVTLDISHERNDLGWSKGTAEVDGRVFKVELKYFDSPSEFGINGGNISKLWVSDGRKDVINYDRGWDVRPRDPATRAILRAIIKEFAV